MEDQIVVFILSNEHYGVSIAAVQEIVKLQPITFVPCAPAFVEGVTNLRGKVLPVIDLRKRFGLPAGEATKNTRIVVAEVGRADSAGNTVGMLVDAVSQVLRVPETAIEPPSPLVTTVDSTFITGIAKVGERLIILLDLPQVLSPEEKGDLQTLTPEALLPAVEESLRSTHEELPPVEESLPARLEERSALDQVEASQPVESETPPTPEAIPQSDHDVLPINTLAETMPTTD